MPYDGTTFDPHAAEDLRLLRLTLASLERPGGYARNFTNNQDGSCVIGWLNIHAGEPRYSSATGQRIAEQRLYPELPPWRVHAHYSAALGSYKARAVMVFNDTSSAWRVRRLVRRAIRQIERAGPTDG